MRNRRNDKGDELPDDLEQIDNKARALHDEFENIPNRLYHYRSQESGLKMLTADSIQPWFASYKYLQNHHDTDEISLGFETIIECIKGMNVCAWFWSAFADKFENIILQHFNIYVLSLCAEHDNPELWETYGKEGAGIALGLEHKPNESDVPKGKTSSYYHLLRVHYEKNEFKNLINKFLSLFGECIQELIGQVGEGEFLKESTQENGKWHMLPLIIASHLMVYMSALKKRELEGEKEYRFVCWCLKEKVDYSRLKTVKGFINSHLEHDLDKIYLKEIHLGSKCPKSIDDFKKILRERTYQTDITIQRFIDEN